MATLDSAKAKQINDLLNNLNQSVLIGKSYPVGTGKSVFSSNGKSFLAQGVATGKAIAFKHKGTWRVLQG